MSLRCVTQRTRSTGPIVARAMVGLLVLVSLTACAPISRSIDGLDQPGRMRGLVESSRVTDFCPQPPIRRADERCIVTRSWDYDRGVTVVRTYDPQGTLILTQTPPGADLSLTAAEQARIETLMRTDPRTSSIVNVPGVMVWSGGFVMREPGDRYCDRGSRCLRAIAAADGGNRVVLHSVVDLMTDRVVYPHYGAAEKTLTHSPPEH